MLLYLIVCNQYFKCEHVLGSPVRHIILRQVNLIFLAGYVLRGFDDAVFGGVLHRRILKCGAHSINYTTLFLKDKQKLLVAKTLKEFEELLTGYNFYRVHNSHLINLAYIKMYNKGKGGSVTMADGSEIEVSTRRKDDFLKRLASL
ncbi:LytR/AlgR family response regulator transcription factor [Parafilimonas sp.]|uniref:LytR/AlgR family response regulator transcription factor n=1 Tax=Parafilimonas sp. TaxID=1969739 RepID=UPI0039E69828